MSLETGSRLGPYEIIAPLGAGGMGEVWRARDTRLDRTVAIKVLPPHLSEDEQARARLEREARAVSTLSHPHICTLYDVGREGDRFFLVIEYLEGETLAQRLEGGPLPPEQLLQYAIQIADALDKAHRQGLIHRDLKPGNVMLTKTGAKLLDFGLAKSLPVGDASGLTAAPTATSPLTSQGTIVGTFQYMAPEQIEGEEADARSDIFAFGVMLYEMATGRKAFQGKTQASLIASILEREPPPVSTVQPQLPPALERLIRACIAKDPAERRQSMHDVLLDLKWIAEAGAERGEAAAPATAARKPASRLAWTLVAVFAVLSAAAGTALLLRPAPERMSVTARLLPPAGQDFATWFGGHLAISPDGTRLVYLSLGGDQEPVLWLRPIDSGVSRRLDGTEGGYYPFWSPDGRYIGFFANGKLRKISAAGGPPLTLCDAVSARGGAWSPNGEILFTPVAAGALFRVSSAGGEPVRVTTPEDGMYGHRFPSFLPDGERFVYLAYDGSGNDSQLRIGSMDGSVDRQILSVASNAIFAAGRLHYVRESTLLAQPLDLKKLQLSGDALIVAEPVARNSSYAKGDFTVSNNGNLAYVEQAGTEQSRLVWYDRAGGESRGVESILADDLAAHTDDRRIAFSGITGEGADIWTYDEERDVFSRISFGGDADDPAWSPDGEWVAFASNGNLFRARSNGTGQPELLLETELDKVTHDWSRDGQYLVYSAIHPERQEDLWALPVLDGGEPFAIAESRFRETQAEISPDGRWIAYGSDEAGDLQVYVQSFPEAGGKWQVSSEGGGMPRWRADGRELFFVALDRTLMAAEVQGSDSGFRVGEVQALFDTRMDRSPTIRTHQYAASQDGQRFVIIEAPVRGDQQRTVVTLVVDYPARERSD